MDKTVVDVFDAEKLLRDVMPEHNFYANNGTVIKSLHELHYAMANMDDTTFNHHLNDQRNDFASWIENVHRDNELAEKLKKSKTKKDVQEHLKQRISHLENIRARRHMHAAKAMKYGSTDFALGLVMGITIGITLRRIIY